MPITAKPTSKSVLPLPAWADSRWLRLVSDYTPTKVTVAGNQSQVVAGADPNRWAIGFSMPAAVPIGATIGPHTQLAVAPFVNAIAKNTYWYTVFEFGAAVMQEWYGFNCDTLAFVLHELSCLQ